MRQFEDSKKRKWTLNITIGAAKKIRDLCGINFIGGENAPNDLARIYNDPLLVGEVVEVLCAQQAEARGVSDFADSVLDAETMANASDAFFEEIINFFQSSRRAEMVTACRTMEKLVNAARNEAMKNLETVAGAPSISSPGSLESSPTN